MIAPPMLFSRSALRENRMSESYVFLLVLLQQRPSIHVLVLELAVGERVGVERISPHRIQPPYSKQNERTPCANSP